MKKIKIVYEEGSRLIQGCGSSLAKDGRDSCIDAI